MKFFFHSFFYKKSCHPSIIQASTHVAYWQKKKCNKKYAIDAFITSRVLKLNPDHLRWCQGLKMSRRRFKLKKVSFSLEIQYEQAFLRIKQNSFKFRLWTETFNFRILSFWVFQNKLYLDFLNQNFSLKAKILLFLTNFHWIFYYFFH